MLQANSVALVATSAPAGRRRAALGMQAGAQAVGLALGPVAGGLLVASAGWRSIFFINVPVGVVAVAAGWFLLPRTRHRAARQGTDPLGLILLAATATGTLVAVSAVSGLGLPLPGLAGCAAAALLAGAGLVWWERRATAPLVDLKMLAANGTWPLLAGALCAYLVLFGPLVLIPQVLTARGGSVVHAGLLLSALPAGFGLAAVAGEKILPARWPDRRRCLAGGLDQRAAGQRAAGQRLRRALAIPAPDIVIATWLGLLGIGLGTYIPANNTAIMTAIPPGQAAAAGGMVNMARGLGTALGIAVVTLALHAAARLGHPSAGPAAAMAALTMCALASAWAGRRVGPGISAVPAAPAGTSRGRCPDDRARHRATRPASVPAPTGWPRASPGCAGRCGAAPASPARATRSPWPSWNCCQWWPSIPEPGPGQLARLLHMRPNTVTTIVNALTARGMISRAAADGDGRAVELTVTDVGQQAVHAWQATNAAVLHLALSTLPEPQQRTLAAAVPAIDALAKAIDRLADTPPADQDPQ